MRAFEVTTYCTCAPLGTVPYETPLTETVPALTSIRSPANSACPFSPVSEISCLSSDDENADEAEEVEDEEEAFWP